MARRLLLQPNSGRAAASYRQSCTVSACPISGTCGLKALPSLTPEELEVLTSLKTFNAAKIVAASLPIVVFYPFMQRFFVSGLTLGSVKE